MRARSAAGASLACAHGPPHARSAERRPPPRERGGARGRPGAGRHLQRGASSAARALTSASTRARTCSSSSSCSFTIACLSLRARSARSSPARRALTSPALAACRRHASSKTLCNLTGNMGQDWTPEGGAVCLRCVCVHGKRWGAKRALSMRGPHRSSCTLALSRSASAAVARSCSAAAASGAKPPSAAPLLAASACARAFAAASPDGRRHNSSCV